MPTNKHTTQPLHFSRWSRKGYATFCSIGKCVVIGRLRYGIADASLRKQENYAYAPATDVLLFDSSCDGDTMSTATHLLQGVVCPIVATSLTAAPQSAGAEAKNHQNTLTSKYQLTSRSCTTMCSCDFFCLI